MPRITLTPAYGRDYKSKAAVQTDISAGKDFIVTDFFHPGDGRPCSPLTDFAGYDAHVRYSRLAKIAVIKLPKGGK